MKLIFEFTLTTEFNHGIMLVASKDKESAIEFVVKLSPKWRFSRQISGLTYVPSGNPKRTRNKQRNHILLKYFDK